MANSPNISIAIVLVTVISLAHLCASRIPLSDKLQYLVPHNIARAAEGMPPLTWNGTLAKFARSYANERVGDCELKHSEDANYGENLAMSTGPLSPTEAVSLWVEEKPDYDYSSNTCKQGKMCGHYTQVLWRNTRSVGCASVQCQNGGTFITCNYYPPGNYIGEKPY